MREQFPLMLVVGVDTLKGVALGRLAEFSTRRICWRAVQVAVRPHCPKVWRGGIGI